jgi:hypothetical protein
MLLSLILSVFAFASTEIAAEYEVPVPAELAAYSRFKMDPVKVNKEGGEVRVRYKLPLLLTGIEQEIEMRGTYGSDGVLLLEGGKGLAKCSGFQEGQQCRVKYKDVAVDLALAEAELEKLGLAETDRAGVLQVIKRFQGADKEAMALPEVAFLLERDSGGDMQGIIHYGAPVQAIYEIK